MIKMQYGNAKHIDFLKNEYVKIFPDLTAMRADWRSLRVDLIALDANFSALLPNEIENLLVMDYEGLADIYELYEKANVKKKNSGTHQKGKNLFNYSEDVYRKGVKQEKRQPLIAAFFMKPLNCFQIHTCHYCDMAYVNAYNLSGVNKAQFDLDHVLDKGRCPIVGLSLFNFVPSCQMCNGSRIKGQKQLTKDARLRKKLSPSNLHYDFEDKVDIYVYNKTGNCSTFGFEKRLDEYEVRFDTTRDPDYEHEIKFFHLEERYNYHKCEALRLIDLKERYTDAKILELARLLLGNPKAKASPHGMKIITQLKHDIFSTQFNKLFHRALGKMHNDVLK